VEEASHDLLPGAALSQNHHRRVGDRGPPALLDLLEHGGASALRLVRFPQCLEPSTQRLHLLLQRGLGQGALDHQQQVVPFERLLQVIECAVAHGEHRAFHRPEGREKDDAQFGVGLAQPPENLLARHPRHTHVEQHQVRRFRQGRFQALERVLKSRHGRLGRPQHALDILAHRGFVVDH
jgi:hypothetical protein